MILRAVGLIVILALGFFAAPLGAAAQPRERIPKIGVLDPGAAPGAWCLAGFRQGLRDLGYVEGQNIAIEYRFAERPDRFRPLFAELVRVMPKVIWTHSPAGARAAKEATTTIPIVVGVSHDLVAEGLAASLARPGGNLTGFELRDVELMGKRLELLKEAVPAITRIAVLVDPTLRPHDDVPKNIETEARKLGVQLQRVDAAAPEAFEGAFAAMARGGTDALMIMDVPLTARNRHRLLELALRQRLPTISGWRIFGEAGSLVSYGANVRDLCQRSAAYVDKILKGAQPGDLPVQRADKFELIINLKTAKALGLTVPQVMLWRADEVIK